MFPGGKDVLFDALRVRELEDFFTRLRRAVDGRRRRSRTLLVRTVVVATNDLRARRAPGADAGLRARRDAQPPHRRGLAAHHPRRHASSSRRSSSRTSAEPPPASIVELLVRLVISYFLAPSERVDLGDPASARRFIRTLILPAFPALTPTVTPTAHGAMQ